MLYDSDKSDYAHDNDTKADDEAACPDDVGFISGLKAPLEARHVVHC